MLKIPFEQFAEYYQINEMSESDENDFADDGSTIYKSISRAKNCIFRSLHQENETEQFLEDEEDIESDGKYFLELNQSLQNADNDCDYSPTSNLEEVKKRQSTDINQ